jgi:cell fate regulator YaaT (PSP1 superfamily)
VLASSESEVYEPRTREYYSLIAAGASSGYTAQMETVLESPIPPVLQPSTLAVGRYGTMRVLTEIPAPAPLRRGDRIIARTERGLEMVDVLAALQTPMRTYHQEPLKTVEFVRLATPEDLKREQDIANQRSKDFDRGYSLIVQHQLDMQLIDVERLFNNERVVFYFVSEKRVDFRDLVRSMARDFQARIELRQVGIRDEAKLLADYGDCGKPVCCNTHMAVMPPVSMRMAKIQKSTLDPNKISGRCGRLKCCLRFEQDVYDEHLKELPPIGSRVVTAQGPGRVLGQEILAKRLLIEFEDGRRLPVPAKDILSRVKEGRPVLNPGAADKD